MPVAMMTYIEFFQGRYTQEPAEIACVGGLGLLLQHFSLLDMTLDIL
jgi:hypothetical protein